MGDIIWREKKVGELRDKMNTEDVSKEMGGGGALLIYSKPDWVRHPQTGEKIKVLGVKNVEMECPVCKLKAAGRLFILESNLNCFECKACKQFVWFLRGG